MQSQALPKPLIDVKVHLRDHITEGKGSPLQIEDSVLKIGYWRPRERQLVKEWIENKFPDLEAKFQVEPTDENWVKDLQSKIPNGSDLSQSNLDKVWIKYWKNHPPAEMKIAPEKLDELIQGRCSGTTFAECVSTIQEGKPDTDKSDYPTSKQLDETYELFAKGATITAARAAEINKILKLIYQAQRSRAFFSASQSDFNKFCQQLESLHSYPLPFNRESFGRMVNEILMCKLKPAVTPKTQQQNSQNDFQYLFMYISANGHATLLIRKTHIKSGKSEYVFCDANSYSGRKSGVAETDAPLLGDVAFYGHQFGSDYVAYSVRLFGYNIQTPYDLPALKDYFVSIPDKSELPWQNLFVEGIRMDNIDAMQYFKTQGADVNHVDSKGWSHFHWAAYMGRAALIRQLKKMHATVDINACSVKAGRTALHMAAPHGFDDVIQAILELKPDLNIKMKDTAPKWPGSTPLHIAVVYDRLNTAKLLTNAGADLFITDKSDKTPLEYANSNEMRKLLAEKMKEQALIILGMKTLEQFLFKMAREGNLDCINALVDAGVRADTILDTGINALHGAILSGHTEVVRVFLKTYIESRTQVGETPLQLAAKNGKTEIVKLLLENKANSFPAMVKGKDWLEDVSTPEIRQMITVARQSYVQAFPDDAADRLDLAMAIGDYGLVNALLNSGARVKSGVLVRANRVEEVQLLLAHKVDIDTALNGKTALYQAASDNNFAVVEVLVKHNAKVDVTTPQGDTPLHGAARCCSEAILRCLLEHKADVFAKNNLGQLPIDLVTKGSVRDLLACTMIAQEMRAERYAEAELLFKKYKPNLNTLLIDKKNNLVLLAAELGALTVMQLFHHSQPQKLTVLGPKALCLAAEKGHIELVVYLLKLKVKVLAALNGKTIHQVTAHEATRRLLALELTKQNLKNYKKTGNAGRLSLFASKQTKAAQVFHEVLSGKKPESDLMKYQNVIAQDKNLEKFYDEAKRFRLIGRSIARVIHVLPKSTESTSQLPSPTVGRIRL